LSCTAEEWWYEKQSQFQLFYNPYMPKSLKRYAAKLLFQFRVVVDGDSGKRRLCEERIVLLKAISGRAALAKAKGCGKRSRYNYKNSDGNPVYFEFIGVLELLCLNTACEENEVWYDLVERLSPLERRKWLIPRDSNLNAIRNRE